MKNFYRICTVAALVLVIGHFFWPSVTPQRRESEIAKAKPISSRAQVFNNPVSVPTPAPLPEPVPTPEPPAEPTAPEPAPQEIVEEPIEPINDDETLKKDLEEEFHALTDELEQLPPNHPDQEMIQQEISEVVDALTGLMRKMGLTGYQAPNGWFIVEEPGGTWGHGK